MNRVVRIAVLAAVAMVLCASCVTKRGPEGGSSSRAPRSCAPGVDWQPLPRPCVSEPSSSPGGGDPLTSIPTYTSAAPDSRGWSTHPIDQPRPLPGSAWPWSKVDPEHGVCGWATPDLLEAFKWAGELNGVGPFCVISIGNGQILQFDQETLWETFTGPILDEIAFIRSLTIDGLQAREYDLTASQESHPGSCQVEVNTRSMTHIDVTAGTADGTPAGTDPAPMCQRAREAATLIVRRYVPLAGGTPYVGTPQQPKPGVLGVAPGYEPCYLFDGPVVWAYLNGNAGQAGKDDAAQTCEWTGHDSRGIARLALGVPAQWQSTLPPLADHELTADTKLGVLPARLQLTPNGTECAESAQYAPGEVVRFSYRNPIFKPEELCRIAEHVLGEMLAEFADWTAKT